MITLEEGALKVVETCAGTRRGERVLVVSDEQRPPEIAAALAEAARRIGAETTVALAPAVGPQGGEPPPDVAAAMRVHDVVLAPTTRSVFHTAAAREAAALGARIMSLVGCAVSTLTTGGIEADFESLEARCQSVAERLTSAGEVQVSTAGGTTLFASIDGRRGIGNTGMARNRGDVAGCPIIEAYIAPIEGSAEGILVIDGSTPFGLVASPIEIVIQSGRAADIRGGADAERILEAIDGPGDPGCRALAEVALGLNPLARVTGNLNEDEGAHRTGHFALGNNSHMGGTNWAPTHVDMVYLQPTVLLDGAVVMRDGELVN